MVSVEIFQDMSPISAKKTTWTAITKRYKTMGRRPSLKKETVHAYSKMKINEHWRMEELTPVSEFI
jgi:hypothetical protein